MIWINIPDFPGYKANQKGEILSLKGSQPRVLKYKIDKKTGYPRVRLQRDGWSKEMPVHVLMALAFLGPRPEGLQVCHNDGNKLNPKPGNLRYDTPKANSEDAVRHGAFAYRSERTHCDNGHEFTPDNVVKRKNRSGEYMRVCRKCSNDRIQRYRVRRREGLTPTPPKSRAKPRPPGAPVNYEASRTHCDNGHRYTAENTWVYPGRKEGNATRRCKECQRIATAKYRARKKAGLV